MSFSTFFRSLPARLARVTSGGKIIREIDGVRFLAIFFVVIQHLSERFSRITPIVFRPGAELDTATYITSHGFIGVHIFFVISGFILGMPFAAYYLHEGRKVSLKSYFWRRVTRLEPPYIISLTLIAASLVVMGHFTRSEIGPHYLASLVYLHNIIFGWWSTINPPVWSLEIEVQFYIMAPFLALTFFKIKNKIVRRATFVSFIFLWMLLQQYLGVPNVWSWLSLLGHLHLFLVGFILADIYLVEWKDGIKKHTVFNYLSLLALFTAVYFWSWNHYLINRLIFASSVFVMIYSIFRSTWVNRFITFPWITAIGGMCYSIYLIHLPILEFFVRLSKHIVVTDIFTVNYIIQFILMTPLLLSISIVFYLLIEKPCMYKDWPTKLRNYLMGKFLRRTPSEKI